MPIGYNASATGDTQLTFPSVADRKRTLGASYLFAGRRPAPDIEIGRDQYGFGADARHMANAKVQTTAISNRQYDRTPRFQIRATGSVQTPCFSAKDESNAALERMLRGQVVAPVRDQLRGGGSIGNLSTPAGQRYKRKILDRRAAELTALNATQDTAPVSTERELSEVEAAKTQIDLEFGEVLDEIDAGVVERGTAKSIAEWSVKFLKELAYYDSNDVRKLINYQEQLDMIADRTIEVLQERTQRTGDWTGEYAGRMKSLSQLVALWAKRTATIITSYMKIINYSLPERIMGVRALLKHAGLTAVAKDIRDPRPEEIEEEEQAPDEFDFAPFEPAENQGPPVPDVGDGAGGDAFGDVLPETAAQISEVVRNAVATGVSADEALQAVINRWNTQPNFPQYRPRAGSFRNKKATLVQRIKAYRTANAQVAGQGRPRRGGRHHRLVGYSY
jgi:hypothetical protein